tara:strand:- start:120 stop:332 length:213 start_codon:yes stop_codon:yes gene_type:complete
MPRFHKSNGVHVQYTAEEEAQRDAEQARDITEQETKRNLIIQRETDKANAKAKLIAGQALTEAEADTIVL